MFDENPDLVTSNFNSQFGCTGTLYVHTLRSVEGAMRRCVGIAQAPASQRTEFFGIAHEPF
jgi:hypothetical protein